MYQRNSWTGLTAPAQLQHSFLGDALDDVGNGGLGDSDALLEQLHLLAQSIVQLRNYISGQLGNVSNADADVDWDGMTRAAQSIVQLQQQFKNVAARRAQQTQDMASLGPLQDAMNAIGSWATGVLNALPSAIAAIPNALVNALGQIVNNTLDRVGDAGSHALSASLPLLAGAGLVLYLVLQGEKSRTYRKAVA